LGYKQQQWDNNMFIGFAEVLNIWNFYIEKFVLNSDLFKLTAISKNKTWIVPDCLLFILLKVEQCGM